MKRIAFSVSVLALVAAFAAPACAADKLKIAVAQPTAWDAIFDIVSVEKGFYKQQDLDVTTIHTAGGAETAQIVTSGSVDIGGVASIHGIIAAYAKGSDIRIIGSQMVGIPDLYLYVKADSPIKSMRDADGKTMLYSRPGSVSHILMLSLAKQFNVTPKWVAGGPAPAIRTMVMTGQAEIGHAPVPFALDSVRSGEIRIIATGADVQELEHVTSRAVIATSAFLKNNRALARRYMIAHMDAVNWVYDKPDEAAQLYAREFKIDVEIPKAAMKFFTRERHAPVPVQGLDVTVRQAVENKFIDKPLTPEQLKELVDVVDPKKG